MTSAGESGAPPVQQQVYASAWSVAAATRSLHAALGRHGWHTQTQPAYATHSIWTRAGAQLTLVVVGLDGGSGFLVHTEGEGQP
jgi:hypothetical protein